MAIFGLRCKVGNRKKGGAQAHGRYIRRDPRMLFREDHPADSLAQNLPSWANSPDEFWQKNDELERKNGSVYREFEVSLPVELTTEQGRELVKNWVQNEFPNQFGEVGFHWKEGNPHAHIQLCERLDFGGKQTAEHYFKREAAAFSHSKTKQITQPTAEQIEAGGCKKSDRFTANYLKQAKGEARKDFMRRQRVERKSQLVQVRASWADSVNSQLEKYGHPERIDHRSNKERGIEAVPAVRLGRTAAALEKKGIRTERARMARALETQRTENELRRETEKRARPATSETDADRAGRAVPATEQVAQPRLASPEKMDVRRAGSKSPAGFSKVENWSDRDLGWLDSEYNFIRPAAFSLTKIQRDGYRFPAYFSASRKIGGAPICIKKDDGEFVVLDAKKISVEELKAVLQLASGDSGGVVLNGTPEFCARAEVVALAMGLEVEHPHQVLESERKEAEERYKMAQASIEDAPRPHP